MSHLDGGPPIAPRTTNLLEALERRAQRPEPWLTFHVGKATTGRLDGASALELAQRWATALSELGVKADDRVAVLQPNCPDFIGAFFGALLLGAVPVPLPWPVMEGAPERVARELEPILAKAGPAVLVTPASMASPLWSVPLVSEPAERASPLPRPAASAQAGAFIQFTSGSTGAPKGAYLTQGAALASATAMAERLGFGPADVGVSWIPFFHDMGLVGVVLCSLVADFEVHVLRPAEFLFRPVRWLELCTEVGATVTVGPNFGFELAVRRAASAKGLDLSRLRLALNGSEPIHRGTLDAVVQAFGPSGFRAETWRPVYGLAEATLGVCFGEGPGVDLPWQGRQVVSVGTPLPGVQIELRREGATVAPGAEGEICVRGPMLMRGYYDDEAATGAALVDGWLHTGDLGVLQAGRLHVTGREKELIIKAGQKFHPYDIERVVADAVDTTPNGVAAFSRLEGGASGELLVVVAELRRQAEAATAVDRIRARLMEHLGVKADVVQLVAAGELPRTTSGKVKRRECAARFTVAGSGAADAHEKSGANA